MPLSAPLGLPTLALSTLASSAVLVTQRETWPLMTMLWRAETLNLLILIPHPRGGALEGLILWGKGGSQGRQSEWVHICEAPLLCTYGAFWWWFSR